MQFQTELALCCQAGRISDPVTIKAATCQESMVHQLCPVCASSPHCPVETGYYAHLRDGELKFREMMCPTRHHKMRSIIQHALSRHLLIACQAHTRNTQALSRARMIQDPNLHLSHTEGAHALLE